MDTNLVKRIMVNPEVCHGKPTIRNSRHMVEGTLEHLAGGDSPEDIKEIEKYISYSTVTYLELLIGANTLAKNSHLLIEFSHSIN